MKASSADLHSQLTTQYAPADDLPCADFALLVPLKKSPEYRTLRPRIANVQAIDSWQEEGLHFFVFALKPPDAGGGESDPIRRSPCSRCTRRSPRRISVVVVTPSADGAEAEVVDLRQPDSAYTAPYSGNAQPAPPTGDAPSQQLHEPTAGCTWRCTSARGRNRQRASRSATARQALGADAALLVPLRQSPEYRRLLDGCAARSPSMPGRRRACTSSPLRCARRTRPSPARQEATAGSVCHGGGSGQPGLGRGGRPRRQRRGGPDHQSAGARRHGRRACFVVELPVWYG